MKNFGKNVSLNGSRIFSNPDVATWERIQHQRQWFAPWQENTALFVDAVKPC